MGHGEGNYQLGLEGIYRVILHARGNFKFDQIVLSSWLKSYACGKGN